MLLLIYLVQFFRSNPNLSLSLSLSLSAVHYYHSLCHQAPFVAIHYAFKLPLPQFTVPSISLPLSLLSKHIATTKRWLHCRGNRTAPSLIIWALRAQSPLPQATLFGFPTTLLFIAISPSVFFLFHNSLFLTPCLVSEKTVRKLGLYFPFLIYLLTNVFHIWIWEFVGNINFLFLIYLLNVFTFGNLLEIECFFFLISLL